MNNTFVMSRRDSMGDLHAVVDRFSHRQWTALELLAQCLTHQQLRNQIGCALIETKAINRQNIGMVERGGGLRFLLEPSHPIRILRPEGRQNFDRHFAL
jgi:hypothetical protein